MAAARGDIPMNGIANKYFVLFLAALSVTCGADVPDYRSREHRDGAESHLAKALLKNDKNAVAYWLEKAQKPSLALCYLLEEQNGDVKDGPVTPEMLDLLFDHGANPNVICEHYANDFSPLSLAVSLERPDIVLYLLARKSDPDLYFTDRIEGNEIRPMSALMLAVSQHGYYSQQIRTYQAAGVKESVLESKEKTCAQIVRLLLAANANVDYQGSFNTPIFGSSAPEDKSALMIAVERFDREMINLLLKKGARKDLKDAHGKTAEAYAADAGHLDLARELMP